MIAAFDVKLTSATLCDSGLVKACECLKISRGVHVLESMRRSVSMKQGHNANGTRVRVRGLLL